MAGGSTALLPPYFRQGGSTALLPPYYRKSGLLTRWLLGNSYHEGLRVGGILHANSRHRITHKRGASFTQVRGPRRGNTRTSCLSDLLLVDEFGYNGAADEQRRWDLAEGKVARVWCCVRVERELEVPLPTFTN